MTNAGTLANCLQGFRAHSVPLKTFERYTFCMRADHLLPKTKRGRGSTPFSSTDAINVAIGCLLGPSDTKAAATVRSIRSLSLASAVVNSLAAGATSDVGQGFRAAIEILRPMIPDATKLLTAGDALDAIVEAMRMQLVVDPRRFVVEFCDRDRVVNIYFDHHIPVGESLCLTYRSEPDAALDGLEQIFRMNGVALQRVADSLGPPSTT